ncbi:MAG: type II toxin-antitoxin system RelE/ParE family toxin [Paludibacterium sp.]|uniref:type II toxin-antitoxin system RelE/ParE family toxin n=1 Tax=Paludibacterium sp. TaxID=1917523 RepID=UPI0025F43232|nr:type II toxin-antitoxin system RelE/ParE family toxin [Paludibacterium sp.]MBV8046901.1 type II toxin-antitoxin system RelE/ParE family toxin [Paludibacterium sp.]MBV8648829.1 type II toxin-antitoxin system RelE/ParE family toxin [Paludibacterium sp.]
MNEIRHYLDREGRDHFAKWREKLRDIKAKIAIDRRIMRVELGNFGDHKPLRGGIWELRIDVGPGYRVYYAKSGRTVVLLLCGGDKRQQDANIDLACEFWRDWQRRYEEESER